MRAEAQTGTLLAGFGVTGSLLAAVGAIFAVGGGVLAFESWPTADPGAPEARIEVAQALQRPAASAPAVVELPADPAPAAAAAAPAVALPADGTDRAVLGASERGTPPPADPVTGTPAGPMAVSGSGSGLPGAPADPLPQTVADATRALAETVATLGRSVPGAQVVAEALAGTGQALGGTVQGLSDRP